MCTKHKSPAGNRSENNDLPLVNCYLDTRDVSLYLVFKSCCINISLSLTQKIIAAEQGMKQEVLLAQNQRTVWGGINEQT